VITTGVVICTHLDERLEQLAQAVESVENQTRKPDEVIVVVDGTADLLAKVEARLPGRRVLGMGHNQGLSHARNQAVAALSAELIFFLDDDAVAGPDWIEQLVDAVGPDVLGASGRSDPIWIGPRPAWLPDEFLWIVGCSYKGQPVTRHPVRNVYGGCCALRRILFTELGGYDESLGKGTQAAGGGEEAQLCLRAHTQWPEAQFVHDPTAFIQHRVPGDRLTWTYALRRSYGEGVVKARMAKRQHGALAPERSFATALPRALGNALAAGARGDAAALRRAGGLVALSTAVLSGMVVGSLNSGSHRL